MRESNPGPRLLRLPQTPTGINKLILFPADESGNRKPSQESLDIADAIFKAVEEEEAKAGPKPDDDGDDDNDDGDGDGGDEFPSGEGLPGQSNPKPKKNRTWSSLWVSEEVPEENSAEDGKDRTWSSLWK